jgi:hypothetical protein
VGPRQEASLATMTDPNTLGALRDVFSTIDGRVDDATDEEDRPAADLFEYLDRPGGDIDALEPPAIKHDLVDDVQAWDDPWPVTYGVDASTTQPLQFSNGLLLGAANAKLGIGGRTDNAALSKESTLTTVVYFDHEEFDIGDLAPEYDTVDAQVFRFPTIASRQRDLADWVTGIARTYAEGWHARRLLDDIDGPIFIDGPLYPSRVLLWTMFAQTPDSRETPLDFWPDMIDDIVTNYLRVVEGQDRADLPVAGIVKSPTSTQVVSTIEAKAPDEVETPLRWGNDNLFFSEALYNPEDWYGDDGAVISYTTWLVQRQMTPAQAESAFVPLEGLDGIDFRRGDAGAYQTAFFYARIPLQNTVVRVEAPLMMVRDDAARERIQRKVLAEIAATRSIPFAIEAADEAATISRENRQRLRRELQHATSVRTYNQLRGYNDLNEQGDLT